MGVEVILEDNKNHPHCIHGPTLLFCRKDKNRRFYACSACRDRKDCAFFAWEDDYQSGRINKSKNYPNLKKPIKSHRDLYVLINNVKKVDSAKRFYCNDCKLLFIDTDNDKHAGHNILSNISNSQLDNPTRLLTPLENAKKEAQYLFADSAIQMIVTNLQKLHLKNVLCIGTPRIHEYIQNNLLDQGFKTLLLDIDSRYRQFLGPLEFCWYNSFNHHFFDGTESKQIYEDFLKTAKNENMVVIMDPPFGGRIEPLAHSLSLINKKYKKINSTSNDNDLKVLWIFPYFMEPHIMNSLPNFIMLDYKVDYDNHLLFTDKTKKGRKLGSPVRIFTNISASEFELPKDEGYRYCGKCERWVYKENIHCEICNSCTSKDGSQYIHCKQCNRCVKSSWKHCLRCNRCCLTDHECTKIDFNETCFKCKQEGHKKNDCPMIKDITVIGKKRRKTTEKSLNKKRR